ncbi:MAG: TM2 domain [Rhodobacteraceae bacterium HLUCCA09]|nr:MAG: TM2 domain [Rhodobacteraceae bacterium HLUCCA09]
MKSTATAYLLWVCLGVVGAHRFYLRRWWGGAVYPVLAVTTFVALFFYLAAIPLFIILVLLLIDAARLPGMVRRANATPSGKEV